MEGEKQGERHLLVEAMSAVLGRLGQVHSLWHQAEATYFEPGAFRVALQNCITTARTVTFILQSHKKAIPDFADWYATYTDRFAADPVMKWAVTARNKIEKQGDLDTLSQVRAELVAGYSGNPTTPWLPSINATPEQIRRSIPAKYLDAHVIKTGVLAIERRWVDTELPDHEILDALAHVYGQLALMVVGLHDHLQWPIPPKRPELGQHLIADLLPDGRTKSMERPPARRTINIKVNDGKEIESLAVPLPHDPKLIKKARKRYDFTGFDKLKESSTFEETAEALFDQARYLMLKDGYHLPKALLFKGIMPVEIISPKPNDRREKYLVMRQLAERIRAIEADGIIFISEAWTAHPSELGPGQFAVDVANRGEALVLWGATKDGRQLSLQARITRKKVKKHKVKSLGETERDTQHKIIAFAPILDVWGRLADLKLDDDSQWPEGF
jgi:hypothetical protein